MLAQRQARTYEVYSTRDGSLAFNIGITIDLFEDPFKSLVQYVLYLQLR